jgi:hypothetical protein
MTCQEWQRTTSQASALFVLTFQANLRKTHGVKASTDCVSDRDGTVDHRHAPEPGYRRVGGTSSSARITTAPQVNGLRPIDPTADDSSGRRPRREARSRLWRRKPRRLWLFRLLRAGSKESLAGLSSGSLGPLRRFRKQSAKRFTRSCQT